MSPSDAPTESRSKAQDVLVDTRDVLVNALDVDDADAQRLRDGDALYARRVLTSLDESRTYVYSLGLIMTVMSVLLPTAALYQFFRAVDNLSPLELIGIIAAACAVAAAHMAVAAYIYVDWRKKRLCYRTLAALPSDPDSSEAAPQSAAASAG